MSVKHSVLKGARIRYSWSKFSDKDTGECMEGVVVCSHIYKYDLILNVMADNGEIFSTAGGWKAKLVVLTMPGGEAIATEACAYCSKPKPLAMNCPSCGAGDRDG